MAAEVGGTTLDGREGETAATLEGLAYVCWWLRDDATTIAARRRAFRLYLEGGDQVSAARVAISLARVHILQGERSIANGWVARAQRLLAAAGPWRSLAGSGSSRRTSPCTPTATRPERDARPSYWVDEGAGKIFCLVEAPDADAAHAVHREAHGLVADEIYQVHEGV